MHITRFKILLGALSLTLAIALTGCNDGEEGAQGEQPDTEETEETNGEETTPEDMPDEMEMPEPPEAPVEDDEVVATVHDREILGQQFNPQYQQQAMMFVQQGIDVNEDEEMREELQGMILDGLIGQELLIYDAEQQGYDVGEEDIQRERQEMIETDFQGDEELFEENISQVPEDELNEILELRALLNQYIEDETGIIEVSEEEVDELLEMQGISLEEASEEQIEQAEMQVEQGKQGEIVQEKMDELRAENEENIEILI